MGSDKFRILVIDDDKDILDLVHLTLSPHYEVLTLSEPANAMEIMDYYEPDLAIVDIMMPKVTGYQILESMKAHPKLQHVAVAILSAKDTSRDMKYGYKLGANLYLTKPFQPERLLKNVQMLLDHNPAIGKPRKKTYSMRDVALRLQLRAGHSFALPSDAASEAQAAVDDLPAQPVRLKRPLGQEAEEQERKKWVG